MLRECSNDKYISVPRVFDCDTSKMASDCDLSSTSSSLTMDTDMKSVSAAKELPETARIALREYTESFDNLRDMKRQFAIR